MSSGGIRVEGGARKLSLGDWSVPCMIGKGGLIAPTGKREGDGATPLGRWPIVGALLRPDRAGLVPPAALPWRWLRLDDGWSDDPSDPAYNRPVALPRATSHERLWRQDAAYDAIIVLGHNDAPPVPGMGSAIFFHSYNLGDDGQPRPTEGCVAIAPDAMRTILPRLSYGMIFDITL